MKSILSSSPQVSVIIPLYNKRLFVRHAINSVLLQTFQDFEIVVINDGSTDGGEEIVESYSDSRIRLINQVNQGVSSARNRGVELARAELIAFLDADDVWLPEYLETILKLRLTFPTAGMYSTSRYRVDSTGQQSLYYGCGCAEFPQGWEGIVPSVFRYAAIYGTVPGLVSSICVPKKYMRRWVVSPPGFHMVRIGFFGERYH